MLSVCGRGCREGECDTRHRHRSHDGSVEGQNMWKRGGAQRGCFGTAGGPGGGWLGGERKHLLLHISWHRKTRGPERLLLAPCQPDC